MKIVLALLVIVALVVFGVFIDISWFLVGGIEEVVHGAQASPASVHQIVWGVVRVLCTGLVTWLTVALAIAVGAAAASKG